MTLSPEEIERDAAADLPNDQAIGTVAELAQQMEALEQEMDTLARRFDAVKQEHTRVSSELLPAAMTEHGISNLRLTSGASVEIKKIVRASIPKAKTAEALAWLEAQGHGDLIKHSITAAFGKGEDAAARRLLEICEQSGFQVEDKQVVHPQTLSAFVREQDGMGHSIPDDLLGVFRGDIAKLVPPKKPR